MYVLETVDALALCIRRRCEVGIEMGSATGEHDQNESKAPYNDQAHEKVNRNVTVVLPVCFVVDKDSFVEDQEREFDQCQGCRRHQEYRIHNLW